MTPPWHLDVLGLPAHADEIAVRRAYAAAVRKIDPAIDPDAFQHLRRAYEAARTWCEQMDTTAATNGEAPAGGPAVAASGAMAGAVDKEDKPSPEESPVLPVDYTVTLAWRFAADVGARRAEGIPRMLDDILAELRTQYIDAPGQFEEHLIDLVGLQRIAHRAEVFAAAETRFHWDEVGHLAALGQRGRWIEGVLSQREAWLSLAVDRQRAWLELFARAEARFDSALVRHWPEIAKLNERFPAWLSLHLSSETLQAWRMEFDARSSAVPKRSYRRMGWCAAVLLAAIGVVGLARIAVNDLLHSPSLPLASFLGASPSGDTPHRCMELYKELDKPDAFAGKQPDEVDALKTRARRCQQAGRWHAQTSSSPSLPDTDVMPH
ncbi:hypothetical protein J2T07_003162 [Luteibacter jiangsuensis]|uniref:J domain-containing protein n=1 Tax=Luteibacter jiangsuensis TaxID=637577 RepID=A0ABT9T2U5_9GAMM|nr:hypothetical protein [Luteibacter jiangsuensis]MDQ0010956.1 hypothetical protein [Luteibacter jiangsuensis]